MSDTRGPGQRWVRSGRCGHGDCVEVMRTASGDVLVRNSRRPEASLRFTQQEWAGFLGGVERGEFA